MSEHVSFPRTPQGDIDRAQVCRLLDDLLPAYALGAASPDEARFVAAALPLCPDAAQDLAGYYAVLAALPAGLPAPEGEPLPTADLLARINRDERPQRPVLAPVSRQKRSRQPLSWAAYAVAVLALLAFGASNLYWALQLDAVRQEQQALLAQIVRLTAEPPVQTVASQHRALTPTTTLEGMQGIFIWSDDQRVGTLYVDGMPPLAAGQAYQLWLMRDDGATAASLGVFTVDDHGAATLVFEAAEPIASYTAVGISIEPQGGSAAPTTPNVAEAAL